MLRSLQHIDSNGDSSPFSSGGLRECPAAAIFLGWSAGLGNSTPLSRNATNPKRINSARISGDPPPLDVLKPWAPVPSSPWPVRGSFPGPLGRLLKPAPIPLRAGSPEGRDPPGKSPRRRTGANTPAACLRLPGPGRRGADSFTAHKKNLPLNPPQPPLPELPDSA